uniref:(northern house mosquito) hypothetical protein n=1 Tax=Culex pipiens TaxID=7175 RepID=A0A8D8BVJ3_CULPI
MGCCAPASVLLEEGSTRSRRNLLRCFFCSYSLQSLFASLPFFFSCVSLSRFFLLILSTHTHSRSLLFELFSNTNFYLFNSRLVPSLCGLKIVIFLYFFEILNIRKLRNSC